MNDLGWGRQRLLVMLAVLTSALVALVGAGGTYVAKVQRGGPVEPLPALGALTSGGGPRFLFSINGPVRPLGVAVSPSGERIFVTESDGERETRVFDRGGVPVGALHPPETTPQTRTPTYVAVSPTSGEIYVSDRHAGAIGVYSTSGDLVGSLAAPEGQSWSPLALAFDEASDLLVTDVTPAGQRALVLGPDGRSLRHLDGARASTSDWAYPNGIATDKQGRVLVADSNNGRVLVLDQTGAAVLTIGRGGVGPAFGLPRGIVVDDLNRLYVVDTINHHIMVYLLGDTDARLLTSVGDEGIGDGQFEFPNGIAIDRTGRLYICDRENNRVQVWTY